MIDRPRLQNIALRKTQQQEPVVHVCCLCGHSSSFSFDFTIEQPTKTCFECGHIEVIQEQQQEVA